MDIILPDNFVYANVAFAMMTAKKPQMVSENVILDKLSGKHSIVMTPAI
jgi:hypothetical protein